MDVKFSAATESSPITTKTKHNSIRSYSKQQTLFHQIKLQDIKGPLHQPDLSRHLANLDLTLSAT